MCKCSGMCPNQEAPGTQGHIEDTSVCGTKMFLQCSGRLQRDCDDFLRGSKLSVALKPLNINVPMLDVEDLVKLLQCTSVRKSSGWFYSTEKTGGSVQQQKVVTIHLKPIFFLQCTMIISRFSQIHIPQR